VLPRARGMGKLALKEGLLPGLDGRHRFLSRNLHASGADHAIVVAVPVRGHARPRLRFRPFVFVQGTNPKVGPASFE